MFSVNKTTKKRKGYTLRLFFEKKYEKLLTSILKSGNMGVEILCFIIYKIR